MSGFTICVSGQMSVVRRTFHAWLQEHGARVAKSVTGATTHLVTTGVEADNPTRKVLEAIKKRVPVVTEAFIRACVAQGRAVADLDPFLLIAPGELDDSASPGPVVGSGSAAGPGTSAGAHTGEDARRALLRLRRAASVVTPSASDPRSEAAASQVMLAETWNGALDPTGWWIAEKLDGVRAFWVRHREYLHGGCCGCARRC